MKVVVINGAAGCGKDTFAKMCISQNEGLGAVTSMVDFTKEIANVAGWQGDKTPKNRKFLSDLKDLIDSWGDCSFKYVKELLDDKVEEYLYFGDNDINRFVYFVMARQPEDIERLKREFDATTICIRQDAAENVEASNHADANVLNYNYDYHIDNNGSLSDLKDAALTFLKEIGV